jgi:SAM-dependent methyltransferase
MILSRACWSSILMLVVLFTSSGAVAQPAAPAAQTPQPTATSGEYEPKVGQAGKDVVWVPSPETTVERMLDVAKVTAQDYVVDLGSGDGRNVIAAAKRGAKAHGVEYNPDMVELSRRNAAKAGVAERATFAQGDMYEADFSQATVLALFLLPDNLSKLRTKFAALSPGTRIVANTFGIEGWSADETVEIADGCTNWCTVLLYFVPAKVAGSWEGSHGTLVLNQEFQTVSGTLGTVAIQGGRVRGDQVSFTAGEAQYTGRIQGSTLKGTVKTGTTEAEWTARRAAK